MSKFMITLVKNKKNDKRVEGYLRAWSAGKTVTYKRKKHKVYYVGFNSRTYKHMIGLVPV